MHKMSQCATHACPGSRHCGLGLQARLAPAKMWLVPAANAGRSTVQAVPLLLFPHARGEEGAIGSWHQRLSSCVVDLCSEGATVFCCGIGLLLSAIGIAFVDRHKQAQLLKFRRLNVSPRSAESPAAPVIRPCLASDSTLMAGNEANAKMSKPISGCDKHSVLTKGRKASPLSGSPVFNSVLRDPFSSPPDNTHHMDTPTARDRGSWKR